MLIRTTNRFPSLWREFDELFRADAPATTNQTAALIPPTDVVESDKAFEFKLDLPGVTPDGIDVKLEGNLLTISAERTHEATEEKNGWVRRERSWGTFARSFELPESVEGTEPQASYKHGVLTVTLPKKEVAQPKSFKVKVEA
ncbi:MAG: Hsp20/alpha crystallin family protein [Myxococcus sp.]|nr:Hsp20/alpha crystallin family protein [Myxococcus sp.]